MYRTIIGPKTYLFPDLKSLMAKASPARSGDYLAGVAAATAEERMAAKMCVFRFVRPPVPVSSGQAFRCDPASMI